MVRSVKPSARWMGEMGSEGGGEDCKLGARALGGRRPWLRLADIWRHTNKEANRVHRGIHMYIYSRHNECWNKQVHAEEKVHAYTMRKIGCVCV